MAEACARVGCPSVDPGSRRTQDGGRGGSTLGGSGAQHRETCLRTAARAGQKQGSCWADLSLGGSRPDWGWGPPAIQSTRADSRFELRLRTSRLEQRCRGQPCREAAKGCEHTRVWWSRPECSGEGTGEGRAGGRRHASLFSPGTERFLKKLGEGRRRLGRGETKMSNQAS